MIFIRKYLSAGLAAFCMVFAAYTFILWMHNKELSARIETATMQRQQVIDINERQSRAIDQIIAQNRIDASLVATLQRLELDLEQNSKQWNNQLKELVNENRETREYLSIPIPDALGRLLDSKAADSNANRD